MEKNRKHKNQRYDRFLAYRCRNRANRNVDCKCKKKYINSFYICNQRYDLLYFCSGRPKIYRNVDLSGYDLLFFAAVRPKSIVTLFFMINICDICAAVRQNSKVKLEIGVATQYIAVVVQAKLAVEQFCMRFSISSSSDALT